MWQESDFFFPSQPFSPQSVSSFSLRATGFVCGRTSCPWNPTSLVFSLLWTSVLQNIGAAFVSPALPSYPFPIRWWLTLGKSSNLFLESAPRWPTAVISEWLDQICVLKSCNHLQTCSCWLRQTFPSPKLGSQGLAAAQSNLTSSSCSSHSESGGSPIQTDQTCLIFFYSFWLNWKHRAACF